MSSVPILYDTQSPRQLSNPKHFGNGYSWYFRVCCIINNRILSGFEHDAALRFCPHTHTHTNQNKMLFQFSIAEISCFAESFHRNRYIICVFYVVECCRREYCDIEHQQITSYIHRRFILVLLKCEWASASVNANREWERKRMKRDSS